MAYRIKAGRADNNPAFGPCRKGEIDIYADQKLIAKVKGDIGYQLTSRPPHEDIYFKFGVYRDKIPGRLNMHFDNFKQGNSLADVC